MFNEYMWQRFYKTGNVDDYLIYKEFDEEIIWSGEIECTPISLQSTI